MQQDRTTAFKIEEAAQMMLRGELDITIENYLSRSYEYEVDVIYQKMIWNNVEEEFGLELELSIVLTCIEDRSKRLEFLIQTSDRLDDPRGVELSAKDIVRHTLSDSDFRLIEEHAALINLNMAFFIKGIDLES